MHMLQEHSNHLFQYIYINMVLNGTYVGVHILLCVPIILRCITQRKCVFVVTHIYIYIAIIFASRVLLLYGWIRQRKVTYLQYSLPTQINVLKVNRIYKLKTSEEGVLSSQILVALEPCKVWRDWTMDIICAHVN